MANAHVNLNFNAFLEKTKLKDDGSNYTDWERVEVEVDMSVGHLIYKTFCKDLLTMFMTIKFI